MLDLTEGIPHGGSFCGKQVSRASHPKWKPGAEGEQLHGTGSGTGV